MKEGTKEARQHQEKGDKPICQICGNMDHVALDYWHRFVYSYHLEDLPQALAALTLNKNGHSRHTDSRAMTHIIGDAGMLSI